MKVSPEKKSRIRSVLFFQIVFHGSLGWIGSLSLKVPFLLLFLYPFAECLSQVQQCDRYFILDLRDSSDAAGDAVYFRMYTDTNTINTGYTDMFFVDQFDDTLNVYNTWGYWLPNTTNIPNDTVDYVLYFLPGITSFPTNFNGHLVTRNPGCQIPFSRSVMGKEEFEQKEKDAFYPNPTDGILRWGPNIGDPPYTLNVYSFFGQIITTIHSSTPEWNLTGISSGFYFLEVQTRSKTHREKVRVN